MKVSRRQVLQSGVAAASMTIVPGAAWSQKKYDDGASDTEIKIGNTCVYSGNNSAYGTIGHAIKAYWAMVNANGGINGRKVNFISYDDAFSPPKTVELTRTLVEQDKVLLLFNTLGTAPTTAIHKYVNSKKIPQLFVATGASKWGDPKNFPWTMGWQPDYATEAGIFVRYAMKELKDPTFCILCLNDDSGKDFTNGVKAALGKENEKKLLRIATYEATDPSVDSQVIQLKGSGATVFLNFAAPKAAAQAIKKMGELEWKPNLFVSNISASVKAVMEPAGFDNAQGAITAAFLKDPSDKQWVNSPDFVTWKAWMEKFNPTADKNDLLNSNGYCVSSCLHEVLKKCGNDLTRENVMRQAASIRAFEAPMLLPGIKLNTSPTDFYPIQAVHLQRFKGQTWELFGGMLSNEST